MTVQVRRPTLWYGALLILIVAGGLFLWGIGARVRWVDMGHERAMRTDTPTRVVVTRAGAAPLSIWVATTGGGWWIELQRIVAGG